MAGERGAWMSVHRPSMRDGDIVILDDLATHRSARAAEIPERVGARFMFLPRYSPDPNLIEMAFSKLRAQLCRIAADVRGSVEGRRRRLPPVHPAGMHEPPHGGRI